jgi:hypothetical protein
MKVNNKLVVAIPFIVLGIVFLVSCVFLLTLDSVSYLEQPSLDLTYELFGNRVISQEIMPSHNFLNAIGLSIKNPNLKNKKDITMEVYREGSLIRTSKLNGLNIPDGEFVKFVFPAIEDSKDTKFEVVLSSPQSAEDESLGIFLSKSKNTTSTELSSLRLNKETGDAKIAFVAYYQVKSKLDLIRYVYNNFTSRFLKDSLFAVFYMATILSGSAYLLINFKKDEK